MNQLPRTNISFRNSRILTLNERIIAAPDTTPERIRSLVEDNEDILSFHMTLMEQLNHRGPESQRLRTPGILVARLAIIKSMTDVLTDEAILSKSSYFKEPSVLTNEYLSFWTELSSTPFKPEVELLRRQHPSVNGVWLSIHQKTNLTQ